LTGRNAIGSCATRSREPLTFLELVGILLALVIVVAVTRYSVVELRPTDRIAYALVNFVVAIPLLAVTVGPF
jgi:hypothetical protein